MRGRNTMVKNRAAESDCLVPSSSLASLGCYPTSLFLVRIVHYNNSVCLENLLRGFNWHNLLSTVSGISIWHSCIHPPSSSLSGCLHCFYDPRRPRVTQTAPSEGWRFAEGLVGLRYSISMTSSLFFPWVSGCPRERQGMKRPPFSFLTISQLQIYLK